MTSNPLFHKFAKYILGLVTLVVTPGLSFDPINIPKFQVLTISAAVVLAHLSLSIHEFRSKQLRLLKYIMSGFIVLMLLSVLFSGNPLSVSIYGTSGRNTGFLTYICLSVLLIAFALYSDEKLALAVVKLLGHLSFVLSTYALFQFSGFEIFNYGEAYGSPVFGTFGNSNFLSAFLGIAGAGTLAFALISDQSKKLKIYMYCVSLLSFGGIFLSGSQQGFLNFSAGVAFSFILKLTADRRKVFATIASILFFLGGTLVAFAFFNLGPAAKLVYQSSLGIRKEYWIAGFQMIKDHPFFGVGLDGFGSWYRQSRTQGMTLNDPGVVSNSAHNVFIDIAVGGGLPLLFIYLLLVFMTFRSIVRVTKSGGQSNSGFIAISAAWMAYLVQSFISINQIGVAIWGWALCGMIIGYEKTIHIVVKNPQNRKTNSRSKIELSTLSVSGLIIGLLILVSSLPLFFSSVRFYTDLKTNNAKAIERSAYLFPYDEYRFIYVSTALQSNNLGFEALNVSRDGISYFPRSFELWRLYSINPNAKETEKTNAQIQLKRLDPFNPNLK
jgi:O-antigen ligase